MSVRLYEGLVENINKQPDPEAAGPKREESLEVRAEGGVRAAHPSDLKT